VVFLAVSQVKELQITSCNLISPLFGIKFWFKSYWVSQIFITELEKLIYLLLMFLLNIIKIKRINCKS